MPSNNDLIQQLGPYQPWLITIGVVLLFILLRITRRALRRRVDQIGYHFMGERGLLLWFWLNSPGVMLHELSHAFVVVLFSPFGFRLTNITLFRIRPMVQSAPGGRLNRVGGRRSLQ